MKKTILLIMIITIVSKLLGLFREITLSYFYGAGNVSDAYIISITVPTIIFAFIGTSISAGFIPVYEKISKKDGVKVANKFTNNLLGVFLIITLVIISLVWMFSEATVYLFASGFSKETLMLAASLTRITIVALVFTSFIFVFKSFLQIKGNFIIPAIIGIPLNLIIILSIYFSYQKSVYVLSYGYLIAVSIQALIFIPYIIKERFKFKPNFSIKNEQMKSFLILVAPILFSVAIMDINSVIDKTIASNIESGAVSAMNYALVINNFVQGVIVMAIVTAVYPSMSKNGNSRNLLQLNKVFRNSSKMIMILVIPATFGVLVFSTEIVSLIFERGLFGNTATNQTATALFYYSIGFLPIGLKQIYIRVFYSINNTIKPMVAGFITVGTNICLNLIFYFYTDMGIAGLALATSISAFIGILYLELELKRVSNIFKLKSISTAVKVILSSILMSAIGKFILSVLETKFTQLDSRLSLIFAIIVSIIFYFIALIILKTEEFNELIVLFKKYINKKKER